MRRVTRAVEPKDRAGYLRISWRDRMSGGGALQSRWAGAALAAVLSLLALLLARSRRRKPQRQAQDPRILAVTRMHTKQSDATLHPGKLGSFATSALQYAAEALVMIDVGDELQSVGSYEAMQAMIEEHNVQDRVRVQPVTPWGAFTAALNAAVTIAVNEGFDLILFQSLETNVTADTVAALLEHMTPDTLVVGAVLQGHEFSPGTHELRGRTCPWNTLALWDVRKLALTGFPLVGNGLPAASVPAGVEEVAAISLLQSFRDDCKAKLARVADVQWDTRWTDPQRRKWHEEKMASKDTRPLLQLQEMRLPAGSVEHVRA